MQGIKFTNEKFIKLVSEKHLNKYDYSLTNYSGAHNKIKIICLIHGEFEQAAHLHLKGAGCKTCGIERQMDTFEEVIIKFKKNS